MTSSAQVQPTLLDYLAALRRRKFVIIGTTVLVAGVALALSLQQTKVYRASAQVLLSRQDLSAALTQTPDPILNSDPARVAATQAGIARLPDVASSAIALAKIRGYTALGLLQNSSVSVDANSDLVTFIVDDPVPANAVRLATAYAAAFTGYSLELATATLKRARTELERKVAALQAQGDHTSALYRGLQDKVELLRTMELLQSPGTVVKRADGTDLVRPTPKKNGMLGALFGLVLGCGLAFLWEALDKRVRNEAEVERLLDLPLLSRLPPPTRRLSSTHQLAMIADPTDIQAEAIRRLRVNLEFANLDLHAKTILITSSVQQEGKSTTIANLAIALARVGRKVALVDLDLRRPAIATFFGIPGTVGVTDVALGNIPLEKAVVRIALGNIPPSNGSGPSHGSKSTGGSLVVLPAGELPGNPGEFVGTAALERLIAELRDNYDIVLIDAPPMGVVGDAMTLSARVDAFVVVARLGVVDKTTLEDLARELNASPTPKLGFVLTGAARNDAYGAGYYGYRGGHPEEPERPRGRRATSAV